MRKARASMARVARRWPGRCRPGGAGSRALPRAASSDDLRAVLAACDRESAGGRRDYAIVLALTRLALRGGEVARLRLADVGWRSGELTIVGKGFFLALDAQFTAFAVVADSEIDTGY